jgi:hypothetical protein
MVKVSLGCSADYHLYTRFATKFNRIGAGLLLPC